MNTVSTDKETFYLSVELLHSIGRNEDLEPGVATSKRLRNFEESSSGVFLKKSNLRLTVKEES